MMVTIEMAARRAHLVGIDAPLLTAELVVDGAEPSQPAISPDGLWVAYAVAPMGQLGERRRQLAAAAADRRPGG